MKEKSKKILIGTGAIALTAALSIAGTMAYLTHQTEQRANNFTFATEGLNADLIEPAWDGVVGYYYDDKGQCWPQYGTDKDGNTVWGFDQWGLVPVVTNSPTTPPDGKTPKDLYPPKHVPGTPGDWSGLASTPAGWTKAQDMEPGTTAGKDPYVKNIGKDDEWVAVLVSFVYAADANGGTNPAGSLMTSTDFDQVKAAIEINDWENKAPKGLSTIADSAPDADTWYYDDSTADVLSNTNYGVQMIFYYSTKLTAADQKESEPLFESITVKDVAEDGQVRALEDLGGFDIYIQGYAEQADAYADANAWVTSKSVGLAQFEGAPSEGAAGVAVGWAGKVQAGVSGSPDEEFVGP